MKKWANKLNRTFSKEEVQMSKKQMKKCSISLAIKDMQIKTVLRFHHNPVRMAITKNTNGQILARIGGKWNSHILLVGM